MEKIKGNSNEQLIETAKERLRWYTMEASEEEFDEEAVDALVNLLNTLEPVKTAEAQNDKQELERFRAYVEQREAQEGISADKHTGAEGKRNGPAVLVKSHKIIAAAAAVLLVIMVAGGSLGAVNASKGNGFFHWLKRDEEGMTMLTSPENMDGNIELENEVQYQKTEDVPEKYREYLVAIDSIEQLKEYELKGITVQQNDGYYGVKRFFADASEEKRVYIGAFIFSDTISLTSEAYLSKEVENGNENEQEDDILIKENPDGDMEYTIYFYNDNVQYYVEGNIDKNILIEIATEYQNIVL